MKVSVVIPAFQSEKTVGSVVDRIYQTYAYGEESVEVIVVDDGSYDDTYRVLVEKTKVYPSMKAIRLQENVGQQNALLCGIRQSSGHVLVTMDDDLQHPPEEIPTLVYAIGQGLELVYAEPEGKICALNRNLGSRFRDLLFDHLFELPQGIRLHSFRAVDGPLAREAARSAGAFFYLSAALLKHNPRVGNVKVALYPRPVGKSNYTYRKLFMLFSKIWIYYSENWLARALRQTGTPYRIVAASPSKGDPR
jgi:undecaprenyl-phosphate 4-deoxy-4-formamido-L-arabinose transferase